eukprot:CAMPEP_0170548108 /NCGR_PEP_ID=MMETSP0211-20121228/6438_1 /TAXON_ID=311385 /ORGANISM="Pseudokeronopsis sp., Strain OXSARD2" /LENGTH=127 /DNA_ID=CAMNT_0010853459 /DNA_START=129 /DNA_END=512 /DNA_ORIENTATION=+
MKKEASKYIFDREPVLDKGSPNYKEESGFFATYPYAKFKNETNLKRAIFYRYDCGGQADNSENQLLNAIEFAFFYFLFLNSSEKEHETFLSAPNLRESLSNSVLDELNDSLSHTYRMKDISVYLNLF